MQDNLGPFSEKNSVFLVVNNTHYIIFAFNSQVIISMVANTGMSSANLLKYKNLSPRYSLYKCLSNLGLEMAYAIRFNLSNAT